MSRLEGTQWYHAVFAWDAPSGRFDLCLNGVLQEKFRGFRAQPWKMPPPSASRLALGGTLGGDSARIAVREVTVHQAFLDDRSASEQARGFGVSPLSGEGRTVFCEPLDLPPCEMALVYESDFGEPLNLVSEDDLFQGGVRVRPPDGCDWILEGAGRAWTEGGRLHVENEGHTVLWNARKFPGDFLLEFGFTRANPNGLAIVFFNARAKGGGAIFDRGMPRRSGEYPAYHSGEMDAYHLSYVTSGRRTSNLRKSFGFFLTSVGDDHIHDAGPGPHTVRILKHGHRIALESRGRTALVYEDDGRAYGPVLANDGHIGFRQMANIGKASYTHVRVWRLEA